MDGQITTTSRTLETLRKQFEAGALDHPELKCVLAEAAPGGYEDLKKTPEDPGGLVDEFRYGTADDPAHDHIRRFYFVGDEAAVILFRQLAEDAGRLLAALPGVEAATLQVRRPGQRWVSCLFDLAWGPRAGSPLQTDPKIDTRAWDGKSPPKCVFGELHNAFLMSVYALDILSSTAGAAVEAGERSALGSSTAQHKPTARQITQAKRRERVREFVRLGRNSAAIALELDVSEPTISRDRQALGV